MLNSIEVVELSAALRVVKNKKNCVPSCIKQTTFKSNKRIENEFNRSLLAILDEHWTEQSSCSYS